MVDTIHRIALRVLLILVVALHAGGVRASGTLHDLAELEKLAIERSPLVKAAEERVNSVRKELGQVCYRYGPDFVLRGGYDPEDRTDLGSRGQEYRVSARVEQDLVRLFRVKPRKLDEAGAELEVAMCALSEAKAKAVYDFRQTYLDGLEQKIQADATSRMASIYQRVIDIRQKRYKSGEELPSEVLRVEKELVSAKTLSRHHSGFLSTVRISIAESLGVDPAGIDFNPPIMAALPEEEQLAAAVSANRALVKEYEFKVKQEGSREAISGMEDIRLYPYVGFHAENTAELGQRTGPEAGFVFSIPIFTGKVREYGKERYKHKAESWRMEERQVVGDIRKRIRYACRLMETEESRIAAISKTVELKESEMRIERARILSPLHTVPADSAKVLETEADIVKSEMEKELAELKKYRIYYEILYLAGLDGFQGNRDMMDASSSATGSLKGLWVWRTERFLQDAKDRQSLLDLSRKKKVDAIYLSLNKATVDRFPIHPGIADLVSALHQSGTSVSALIGNSSWIYPEKRRELAAVLEKIAQYNGSSEAQQRFDSVHLDIEPHTLQEWKRGSIEKRQELLLLLLETCREARAKLHSPGGEVRLEIDIPVYYDKTSPDWLDPFIDSVDTVVLMAYEMKSAAHLLEAIKEEVDSASRHGKRFVVGLRAKDFSTEADLDRHMAEIEAGLRGFQSFGGFAIHDLDQYQDLLKR